jgi:transposase
LSEAEKDALLLEQAALIEHLSARVTELEAALKKPKRTSSNSHTPPSQDGPGRKNRKDDKASTQKKPRPSRPGVARPLSDTPDQTERCVAEICPHCGTAVSAEGQRCRHRYDHIELPEIRPVVTRVELFGGRCGGCGKRYRAEAPPGKTPGSPFGPGIRSLLLYLHHSHHVSFERLAGLSRDLFGLKISEGAIANIFQATTKVMEKARIAIRERLVKAQVIASDETTTRIDGVTHWHWVFLSKDAVLHDIAAQRAIRVGKRRESLKDSTLISYAAKADRRLDTLLTMPVAHPAGKTLQRQIKAWRTKFFVFLEDRRVPPTNNISEREIRPSVIFRKVTNGFRSDWGSQIHAGYRSVTGTARLKGQAPLDAIRDLIQGNFALA